MLAGFPITVPGVALNRFCSSGQQAIHFAAQAIAAGDHDYVLASGVESMTRVPMGADSGESWKAIYLSMREQHDLIHQGESAERMAEKLCRQKHRAGALHGNLKQSQRDRIIQSFRDQNLRVLVATDIAARGLDIPHIEHIINYDLPQCPEDYIHRIGRTARNGAEGAAVNFLSPEDGKKWKAIHRLLNPNEPAEPSSPRSSEPRRYRGAGRPTGGPDASKPGARAGNGGGRNFRYRGQRTGGPAAQAIA